MGKGIVNDLVLHAGLAAGDDVLDVGCGSGRVAIPLIETVGPEGSYEGFDVVPEAISWCTRRITSVYPNFRFQLADVYSHHYHRKGSQTAESFVFPFDDEQFDLVFLTSIVTHLGAAATERYLRECARVLRPGGRIFATFFLMDEFAAAAAEAGTSDPSFGRADDGSYTANPRDPGAAVAHDEPTVRSIVDSAGLDLAMEPIRGKWSGRTDSNRHQDIVVAVKRPAPPPG
jgi:ubiquinone/menaquinone biosynthesis C-methylase UbiE